MPINEGTLEHLMSRVRIYSDLATKYELSVENVARLVADYEDRIKALYDFVDEDDTEG